MLDHALSSQQLAFICALSSGANLTAAAQEAGVHRNTIANWRRNFVPFQRALSDAQYDRALLFREKVEDQVDLAIQSLREILTNPNASPSVKLRAALIVIQTAITPPEPKKQIELEIETVVVQQASPEPMQNSPKDAQPDPAICVNSRSFAAHSPRNDTPRNAKCPCGSGLKYKRCCLDKDRAQDGGRTDAVAA